MALIIKDLPQSDDLDREAMRSMRGGGSTGAPGQSDQAESGSGRILEYPPGFGRQRPIPARSQHLAG